MLETTSIYDSKSLDPLAGLPEQTDLREALFNAGQVGPIKHVQVSSERVASLRGILLDLDPKLYLAGKLIEQVPSDPREFYEQVAKGWLTRHEVLAKAEVRNSGTGLHVLLWFSKPVILETDGDRQRWTGIIQVVQTCLPSDPDAPHLTAVTRPLGSINSKNGACVEQLRAGEPVTEDEVVGLYRTMVESPFRTTLWLLTGRERISPCPLCRGYDTRLDALGRTGKCYGSCGKVSLSDLYDRVLKPRQTVAAEGSNNG